MIGYNFYTRLIEYLISSLPISNVIHYKKDELSSEDIVESKLEVKAVEDKVKELISN